MASSSPSSPLPNTTNKQIPASLGKYFKTTAKAQKLMDPDGRICELDRQSLKAELVYSTHPSYHKGGWRQFKWSQSMLWEAAQNDPSMRITRKSPQGLKAGGIFQVYENDFYNNADDEETAADAKASSETEWRSLRGPRVSEQELGFEQVQRAWIYLLSEKQAPDTPEIERRKGG